MSTSSAYEARIAIRGLSCGSVPDAHRNASRDIRQPGHQPGVRRRREFGRAGTHTISSSSTIARRTRCRLSGLSIQYTSATGVGNFGANATLLAELPNVMLDPDTYFLVQMAGGSTGAALPTPDHIDPTPIAMALGAGKVALVTGTATLGCNGGSTPCDAAQLSRIIDLVGYGNANFFEGAAAAGALSNTTAAVRLAGNVDTDNNSADFAVRAPEPRNTSFEPPPPPVSKPIYELQGEEETSAFKDTNVSTTGIVTARKTNGFFLQVPDIERDGDDDTSDALFVFTSVAPAVAVGDEVRVVGRLVEFRSGSAVTPGTLTEISNPVVTILSSGNALPTALDLAALLAAPASFSSRAEQFEQYEAMLVTTSSMDVVGPSNTFGELYAVVSGTPRPFRELGIDVGEALPVEAPAGVERFDGNFERVMLDSDDLVNAAGVRRRATGPSGRDSRRTSAGSRHLRATRLRVRQLSCRARYVGNGIGRPIASAGSSARAWRVHDRVAQSREFPRRHRELRKPKGKSSTADRRRASCAGYPWPHRSRRPRRSRVAGICDQRRSGHGLSGVPARR